MEKTLSSSSSNPLYEKYIHKSYVYRAYLCIHLLLLLSFLTYRLLYTLDECCRVIGIIAFCCELWFSLQFVLYHNLIWLSIEYKAYPERLARRYDGESASKLPPVDIIITTTDPYKEPAIITANTVLSVLALDYPIEKLACYVSDDGGSPITFYSLVETLEFAKKWVPFCRNFNIALRIPLMYFSKTPESSDPKFLQQWQCMKDEYENMKRRIDNALETGYVTLESVCENGDNDFMYKSSDVKNHSSIVKVIHENKVGQTKEGPVLPHLIYVAREKRPKFNHHYKAGAMNAMARVSGLMTNAPFILNLDCDMHVCNPKVIQHAMCFYLDCPSERDCGFVQFPQLFYGTLKDDPFGNQLKSVFNVLFKGMNGIQGPVYGGTCCFHRRKGLYGVPPRISPADQLCSKEKCLGIKEKEFQDDAVRRAFGVSSALVASARAIMRDSGCQNKSYPSLAIEEALKVASCSYEANTAWGKEVGWMYGSSVEDVMTGMKIHSLGWHSIFYGSEKPAFMGCAPGNGPDSLVQYRRWATGMLEIFISRLCPFLGRNRQLTLRQRMLYAYCTMSSITSMAALGYVLLPAFSLLSGKSFLPKIEDPAFMVAAALFVSMYGNGLYEYVMCGCSVREWWNNQRMALIVRLSSRLFALFDVVMKLIGLSQTGFVVTPKGGENDEGNEVDFTFNSSPLFIPPTTVLLINLAALAKGTLQIVGGQWEFKDKQFAEYFCSAWVLINLWPFLKGLVKLLRHENRKKMAFSANPLSLSLPEGAFEAWVRESGYLERLDQGEVLVSGTGSNSWRIKIINPFGKLTSEDFSRDAVPWAAEFWGAPHDYSRPTSFLHLKLRMQDNVKKYLRNYIYLSLLILASFLYKMPVALLGLISVFALWDMLRICNNKWGLQKFPFFHQMLVLLAKLATTAIMIYCNIALALCWAGIFSFTVLVAHSSLRKLTPMNHQMKKENQSKLAFRWK